MQFNDLLRLQNIGPDTVNVILHSPRHAEFAKVLPTLFHTRRTALDMYQATHSAPAERALKQRRDYAAVFVRVGPAAAGRARMVFAGIYANQGWKDRPWAEIWAEPEAQYLAQSFGVFAEDRGNDPAALKSFFDLRLTDLVQDLIGRLVIAATLTQTYVRKAENLDAPVLAILEQGIAETTPPDWRDMTVSTPFLQALPQGWANRLSHWRGIYLIVDETDGASYVGSACGQDNFLGRWRAHVAGEVGVTARLRQRNPVNFRFSILEHVPLGMPADDVIRLEHTWMTRLHTRTHGLNT